MYHVFDWMIKVKRIARKIASEKKLINLEARQRTAPPVSVESAWFACKKLPRWRYIYSGKPADSHG